ncbi:hypothetical protein AV530_012508 [Patagioenas fasciata monilis]|uniref:Uncharacterized protein n=1 Tax=Patagioenas fasciata monilis TaxID=372326 RepID=A0A1V4JBK3_PATFA|nr:hypothetical protein AV530_012508 [Patagioenas fasciata monilis]
MEKFLQGVITARLLPSGKIYDFAELITTWKRRTIGRCSWKLFVVHMHYISCQYLEVPEFLCSQRGFLPYPLLQGLWVPADFPQRWSWCSRHLKHVSKR